jgi:vacuolar protein sorting-associated protein 54
VFTFSSRVCNVSPMNSLEGVSSHTMAAAFAAFDAAQYNKMLSLTISGTQAYLRHCQHVESCIMSAVERAAAEQNASRTRLELVGRAAQGAVAFWATLLGAWSSAQRTSDLHEFTAVLEATDRFANVVESHVSKTISALRGPVQEVCRAGLGRLHVAAMQRLSTALEVERWTYVPVTPEVQECVKQLQNCSQGEFIKGGNGMVHTTPELGAPHLLLDGQEYQLVETVQVLFKLVHEYFLFCNTAPLFVADVTQRILDLLRTFNSKTCQLILGAGAMHIAGLKSITVKHLATACHSLRAVTAMIRLLRPCFIDRIVTPTRRNLFSSEFNLVEEDLRMHCEELCNKIIGIMCERMDIASKDLQTTLSAAPVNESTNEFTASSFASSTVKQVNILSDILVKTSLATDIELVLKTVVDKYASSLESAYSALLQLQDQPLAKQASTDLEYLVWNFAALPLDEEATDVLLAGMRSLLEQGATALPQQSLAEENAPVLSGLDACVSREDQEDIKEATGSETHEASLEIR